MIVRAHLDHKIRVKVEDLPDGVAPLLIDALTIPNLAKAAAAKNHEWGWEALPDQINLWDIQQRHGDDFLVMPRGFRRTFSEGMLIQGHKIDWIDHRQFKSLLRIGHSIHLNKWQDIAVPKILLAQEGVYKAPAGSGKTVAVLSAVQQLGCQSLIIVNKKDLIWQWVHRVVEFLGESYPVGTIGDQEFHVSPYITIATAQTLHRRYDELAGSGFFDQFSFVCLDEMHHATAETYNRLLDRFSSRYRVGVSATPDKTGDYALAQHVLGEIIHETRPSEVDTLEMPKIVRVPTNFFYPFKGTRSRWQRSNYGAMIETLIFDEERNQIIIDKILLNEGHHQLLFTDRLDHIDLLETMLLDSGFGEYVETLTGRESGKKGRERRQYVKQLLETEPGVVLSTVADEGLDVPRLDRGHLAYPHKNDGLIVQEVGRFERKHPDKEDAIIYDYVDWKVTPLVNHWRIRRREVYERRDYEIELQPKEDQHAV